MRALALLPFAGLFVGAVLIAVAVASGGATLALVLVVPVVSGRSSLFLIGVVLLLVGFVSLPLVAIGSGPDGPPEAGSAAAGASEPVDATGTEFGGFVLIGPVPIFFGRFRRLPRRLRLGVVLVGAALFALLVAVAIGAIR